MNLIPFGDPDTPGPVRPSPDMSGQWLTVAEAVAHCTDRGLSRNMKTVRRWAQRSHARPENAEVLVREQDTPNGFRYVIEKTSLDRKIAQELAFDAKKSEGDRSGQIPTGPDMSTPGEHGNAADPQAPEGEDRSTPVRTDPDMPVRKLEVASVGDDFLKDQISQKDGQITELNEQIKRRDRQIDAMLERDKETNILINGLQEALSQSLGIESPTRMQLRAHREGDSAASEGSGDAV